MKPLAIDFSPKPKLPHRTGWLAGGASALLVLVTSVAWLPTSLVEASHMAAAQLQRLPGAEAAQVVDAAVRELNLPWLGVLDALATSFGSTTDTVLLQVEADPRRAVVRLEGEARDAGIVQDIPARLRALPPIAAATLVGQEMRAGNLVRPVRFVIELRLQDSP